MKALSILVGVMTLLGIQTLAFSDERALENSWFAMHSNPTNVIQEGDYVNHSREFVGVHISKWANDYLMEGWVIYGSNQGPVEFPFQVQIANTKDNVFDGKGTFIASGPGIQCDYDLRVQVYAYEGELFVKHFAPMRIGGNSGGQCFAGQDYRWVNHKDPYKPY